MATIKDVAKKSGFSVCTVSRALSGKGYLKEETRQKIMDAVKELDYRPNTLAVNLKTGRRQTLALILPSLTNIYYAKLEQYMEAYASQKGYLLYLSNTEYNLEKEKQILDNLIGMDIAGVIICTTSGEHEHIKKLNTFHIPYICLNRNFEDDPDHCLRINNRTAAFEAVDYMIRLGHTNFGGLFQSFDNGTYQERYAGMMDALALHGLSCEPNNLLFDINPEDMGADNFILASENQMSQGLTSSESIVFAVVFILMFVVCGYLLIYNIFDISVMQDVRQYGLLRTIGTSTRQIKGIVNRQAIWLTLIGLPIGLIAGFFAGWVLLPIVTEIINLEYSMVGTSVSTSPLIFVIAALFTILTVFISTRKPAKKAAKISPLEAIRYTEQNAYKKRSAKRTNGVKLSRMAFSNLGRNRRRSAFIIISLLLCIVLFNSIIIVTQSLDEEKWVNRVTRTDFNVYNSAAFNVMESVQHHEDTLSQQAVDLIAGQPGVEDERYLYRNTKDDRNVLVDYGFEDLSGIELFHEEEGVVNQSYQGYSLYTSSDTERRYFGNVMGASENFWADMRIFEGEKDAETLTQKMATGEYVIIGCPMDKLTEEPRNTPLTDQLQVGESISFYKDGELVKTSTILAKAILVGTETETPTGTTAQAHIAADAPFVYLPDTVFKEIYDAPTLLTYGFNVDEALQPQMEEFLSSYVSENSSVAYTSTKLLKEQLDSVRSMILVIGGLIGCIMAFAGLINFINMIITNIITRRHEFATMQSIGMTGKQLRRLMVYEGIYYAAGADIIGGAVAAILAVTVLKSALNGPSMWFFTLNITLVPVLVIGVLYLLLAAVIPLIVLHFFNKGTVVERLRTSE